MATASIPETLPKAYRDSPFVDRNGRLTDTGEAFTRALRDTFSRVSRLIPCDATGTNVITLTPFAGGPLIANYVSHDVFQFVAANTSTGDVTALVQASDGARDTLKVYTGRGAAQATTGDITAALFYQVAYVETLDGGNGGFVIL